MAKRVLSIEFGVWTTKVALVDVTAKIPKVCEMFTFHTPENAIDDGYVRDKDGLAAIVKDELAKHQIVEKSVVFCITSNKVITRELVIPVVKDKMLDSIVNTHAKDEFPMDISNYTLSYRKMNVVDTPEGKKQKLLLMAIPDNLLSNYVSFSEILGLELTGFEYLANAILNFPDTHKESENHIVVQLEEQSTIISIIEDKKLVFQRVAPYGYNNAITETISHPVLELEDEYRAFEYLLNHDVFSDEYLEGADAKVADAHLNIRETLYYHIRVVSTALDYYKNQNKGDFNAKLLMIGEGSQLAGIKNAFATQTGLEIEDFDYATSLHMSGKEASTQFDKSLIGQLPVIGSACAKKLIIPKDLKVKVEKKNELHLAYVVLAASVLISVVLCICGITRKLMAVSEQDRLTTRYNQLYYIQDIYNENAAAKANAANYQGFENATHTDNEQLAQLIADLERQLPSTMQVENLTITDNSITMNVTCDTKLTAAQMLMNFKNIKYLGNVSIPSLAESDSEEGTASWSFTVSANYVDVPEEENEETESTDSVQEDSSLADTETIDETSDDETTNTDDEDTSNVLGN